MSSILVSKLRAVSQTICSCSLVVVVFASTVLCAGCGNISAFGGFGKSGGPTWEDLCKEATDMLAKPVPAAKIASTSQRVEELYTQAVEAAEKKYGPESNQVAICLGYLAPFYKSRQDWRKAGQTYKRLLELKAKIEESPSAETKQFQSDFETVNDKLKAYGLDEETLNKKKTEGESGEKKKKKKKKKKTEEQQQTE